MTFSVQRRTKLHSTIPLERLNKELKRRADVIGIFPNEAFITRLIGTILFEPNDEWQTQHQYMLIEASALDRRRRPQSHPRTPTRRRMTADGDLHN